MDCSRNDVVLLPIPFSDLSSTKVRPAIVIGHGSKGGDLFFIPITSRIPQGDFPISDWEFCGLNVPSAVKGQMATVESSLVLKITGRLSESDIKTLDKHLRVWLELT